MNQRQILTFIQCVAVALGFSLLSATVPNAFAQKSVSFEDQIKPFLNQYCIECHQGEDAESFRMDNDEMMSYVVAGKAGESELYTHMMLEEDDEMLMPPADHDPRPSAGEIMLVKTWINQGATTAAGTSILIDDDKPEVANDAAVGEFAVLEKHGYNAIGSLHTAAIHLPIGLLLAAGLFGFLSLRGSFVMSDCAYYCLWLGTLGAIFACVSGWWYSPMEHRGTVVVLNDLFDQTHKVFWHRTGGLIVTAGALVICVIAKWTRDSAAEEGIFWKVGAIVIAASIGWVGHEGGELTYGKDHYKDLNAVVEFFKAELMGKRPKAAGKSEIEAKRDAPAAGTPSAAPESSPAETPLNTNDI